MAGKLKAAGLLALMFGLGVVSGIAWQVHVFRHGPHHWAHAERRMARLKKELHLNAWQEEAFNDIIQDAHEGAKDIHDSIALEMAQIRQESLNAIQELLTPEQLKAFEKIRARHHWRNPAESFSPPDDKPTGAG